MESGGRPPAKPRAPGEEYSPRRQANARRDRPEQFVFHLLRSIVQADDKVTSAEREILERYRRALDVRDEAGIVASPAHELNAIPAGERVHVLGMLIRVAHADGTCSEVERALLDRLAETMGIPRVQFADLFVSVERQVRHRTRTRRWLAVLSAVTVVALGGVLLVYMDRRESRTQAETDAIVAETREELDRLRQRIDEVGGVDRVERDLEQIRETSESLKRVEGELVDRVAQLERAQAEPTGDRSAELAKELGAVKRQLEQLQERQAIFKRLERRYADSILLILVRFDLVSGSERKKSIGYGSGFFVSDDGLIATNKHVVQPWKFVGDSVRLLANGYTLDETSVRMAAWTRGAEVFDASGRTVLETAFDSARGTLKIALAAPDEMERRPERLPDGSTFVGSFHTQSDSDLVLLEANVSGPVTPLPLAPDLAELEKLDQVMVLGFPSGPGLLEQGRAETSPSLGEVRKIENSLFITAPIVPGNSGGPVIDQSGRVIGIATRTSEGQATVGSCIQSRHVLSLLERLGR